jgi:hypothetical protein
VGPWYRGDAQGRRGGPGEVVVDGATRVLARPWAAPMPTLSCSGRCGHGTFRSLRCSSPTKASPGMLSRVRGSRGTRLARLEVRGARDGMLHVRHGRHGHGIAMGLAMSSVRKW